MITGTDDDLADALQRLEPVQVGHHHVEQDQIGHVIAHALQRVSPFSASKTS